MHRIALTAVIVAAALAAGPALAGRGCDAMPVEPLALARASDTALQVHAALAAHDAPVALVSRSGTDLSRHGLRYSHVGIAVRDHPDGAWTVVHLLNGCGSDRSGIYAEGLVNFFADDLVDLRTRLTWLEPATAQRLATLSMDGTALRLHQPRYNLVARPGSQRTQNSTAWVLEMLAVAASPANSPADRHSAHRRLAGGEEGHDLIDIPRLQRLAGGLFAANTDFRDHPLSTRVSGRYPVVTERSIQRWLQSEGLVERWLELGAESGLSPGSGSP